LDSALSAAIDEGLSQITFGRLVERMGISDRIFALFFEVNGLVALQRGKWPAAHASQV